jgi:hypothetical protein
MLSVRGVVRRVYRSDGRLDVGDEVRFGVWVSRPGDSILDMPEGPVVHDLDELKHARYLEVFLEGTPPQCMLAGEQCLAVSTLGETPSLRVPTREEVDAAWEAFDRKFGRWTESGTRTFWSRLRDRFAKGIASPQ